MANPTTATGSCTASSTALRRLRHDLASLQRSQNAQIVVRPSEDLLEWHFVLHSLPADTPYHGGCYHGKILFPPEYPHAPPAILMVTPSGRLETGHRLCLSMTDFHPESWNPAWSVETILVGLLSFFISDVESGYGAVVMPTTPRRRLAKESWAANARDAKFRELFPEYALPPGEASSEEPSVAEQANETSTESSSQEMLDQSCDPGGAPAVAPGHRGGTSFGSPGSNSSSGSVAPCEGSADEGEDTQLMECWICRDTSSNEPLIQPCACRGSMSGVHASCVEQWIQHHRRNAVNDEVPRCSVCHQQYTGYERRPGVRDFLRHMCYDAVLQLVRTMVLVLLLVCYQGASDGPGTGLPLATRILLISVFAVAAVYKVMVLTVSLPPHLPPPRHPVARRFFVADYRSLAMHIAEAFAAMSILGIWCLSGTLSIAYLAPLGVAALIPIAKLLCARHPSMVCLMHFLMFLASLLLLPWVLVVMLCRLAWRNPRRVLHPLDAGPHVVVALAVIPLCLCLPSNVAAVVVWSVHSGLVSLGLLEMLLVRQLHWHEGAAWWFALQLSALAAYVANAFCEFPQGIPEADKHKTAWLVLAISTGWLSLVCMLAVCVNWHVLVRHYRTWQHRHGTFTLQVPARPETGLQEALSV